MLRILLINDTANGGPKAYRALAAEVGCTPAQLSIAWLLHKAPHILPIPGTANVDHLLEDLGADGVVLSADAMQRLQALVNENTVSGNRYSDQANRETSTTMAPDLAQRLLERVLAEVDRLCAIDGEPDLAVLVVRESDRLPGQGWWVGRRDAPERDGVPRNARRLSRLRALAGGNGRHDLLDEDRTGGGVAQQRAVSILDGRRHHRWILQKR